MDLATLDASVECGKCRTPVHLSVGVMDTELQMLVHPECKSTPEHRCAVCDSAAVVLLDDAPYCADCAQYEENLAHSEGRERPRCEVL